MSSRNQPNYSGGTSYSTNSPYTSGFPANGPAESKVYSDHTSSPKELERVEIKLLVSRIPRNYEKNDVRALMEEFGVVLEVEIVRDKTSDAHRGSAYVLMDSITSADLAIKALNEKKILDDTQGPVQIRYAPGEPERIGFAAESCIPGQLSAKLFVGSLPRYTDDATLKQVFAPFGQIDDIFIMRDAQTNVCKGYAFVTYTYKESAINAMRKIHGSVTLQGASRPLEVRFAESKKGQHTGQQPAAVPYQQHGMAAPAQFQQPSMYSAPPYGGASAAVGSATDFATARPWQQSAPYQPAPAGPGGNLPPTGPISHPLGYQAGAGTSGQSHWGQAAPYSGQPIAAMPQIHPQIAPQAVPLGAPAPGQPLLAQPLLIAPFDPMSGRTRCVGDWKEYMTTDGRPYYYNEITKVTQWDRPPDFDRVETSGTPGSNVFVFHVPSEWTQHDLFHHFHPFGTILSARVAIDKQTGRNRGYAFVSYDSPQAAVAAVQAMNGFPTGNKHLKVSIKLNEEKFVQHLVQPGQQPGRNAPY